MRDPKTGLCIQCKPDEEGEIIGLVRPDDRGGPEKFQVILKNCKRPLTFLQPLNQQGHAVPQLKDLIHICLETESQVHGMTFNMIYVCSK